MMKSRLLAAWIAVAGVSLVGCATQQSAAPVEVISIDKDPVILPSPDDPIFRPEEHTVARGETLGEIALLYGLDYRDIALWNNIPNPDLIEVGQKLQLHPPSTQPEVATIEPIRPKAPAPSRVERDDDLGAAAQKVTRAQVGVGGARQRAAAVEVLEPVALKIPYSEEEAERLMAQSGGVEQAALQVRTTTSAAGPPRNVRERNGIAWSWPVNGKLSNRFSDDNKGIDISGPRGQPIYSSASGEVIYAGSGLPGYGQLVIIRHTSEYLSTYAHNDRIFVAEGEKIERGKLIAEMGDTGSDRVRLHFEIRRGTESYDPELFLPKNP